MHVPKAALALLAALTLVPLASSDMSFNAPSTAINLSPGTDGTLNFTASLSCDEFVTGDEPGAEQTRTVAISYPDGFSGDASKDVTFDGTGCIPGVDGDVDSDEITFTITPGPGALGMTEMQVELSSGEDNGTIPIIVDYRPGYQFVVDQQFPVEVSKDENGDWTPIEFTADIVLSANANTMVMMQVTDKVEYGTLSGLFANKPVIFSSTPTADQILLDPANGATHTVTFRYTPTAEGWENDTLKFVTWSHWLDDGTMKTTDQTVSWTFVNADAEGEGGGKGIPSLGAAPVALALLAAALVATRRRA